MKAVVCLMNIEEAKIQIQNALKAYLTKDIFGNYMIPIEHQRPVFLMGPPGVGKTAAMEQVARQMNVGFVSYTMTHHTRQSALGLPFIVKKVYGGKEYYISEYTMSEIIASIYDQIEKTGQREGILFLDEINCVSETLSPVMLQFLQYKCLGRYRIPDGWMIVAAGNPPEYNASARNFDIVTWDRLKRIDVEPDYEIWRQYAKKQGIHAAIISYLDLKRENFYQIETTADGTHFVTARGWLDLSDMMIQYEQNGFSVNLKLALQYLQIRRIAKDFVLYYRLFCKYQSDYQIEQILNGCVSPEIINRAKAAGLDERLHLIGLLLDEMTNELREIYLAEKVLMALFFVLDEIKQNLVTLQMPIEAAWEKQMLQLREKVQRERRVSKISKDTLCIDIGALSFLEEQIEKLHGAVSTEKWIQAIKTSFETQVEILQKKIAPAGDKLSNIFVFCEEAFADGEQEETVIFVTELTRNRYAAYFIGHHGEYCEKYFAHSESLRFYDRQRVMHQKLAAFHLSNAI